jgi:hypothetical protein|tara:strand:+ start:1880 stop:2551 length:672 start_codon:yes stop_codon:yes gene_type:complete
MLTNVSLWEAVHVLTDISELNAIAPAAVQLNDVSHVPLHLPLQLPLEKQLQLFTQPNQPSQYVNVLIPQELSEFMVIAGLKRLANTANVTPTVKSDVLKPLAPQSQLVVNIKIHVLKQLLMDVATLYSADHSNVAMLNATSHHHLANTTKTASLNKFPNVVAHTLVPAIRTSVVILDKHIVALDTKLSSPLHTNVAQSVNVSHVQPPTPQQNQQHHLQHQLSS